MRTLKSVVWSLCLSLLVGFIFVGNGSVLCVSEDGHVELEAECLPCCSEGEAVSEVDLSKDDHDEHADCHGCSDLSLDGPLWSQRVTSTKLVQTFKLLPVATLHTTISAASIDDNLFSDKIYLTFDYHPPSAALTVTCLRC